MKEKIGGDAENKKPGALNPRENKKGIRANTPDQTRFCINLFLLECIDALQ